MKNSIVLGFVIALIIAVCSICFFVHPVLILSLGDIMTIVLVDVVIAFILALYLSGFFEGDGSTGGKNSLLIWTAIGAALPIIPIIAAIIKYKKNNKK